jgi:hypothetical protein
VKPITLNLASRPFRNNTVVGSVLAGIAALLIAATAANVYVFVRYGGRDAALRAGRDADQGRLVSVDGEERGLAQEIARRDFKRLYERGRFANDLILRRAFSWTLLFNKLETVVPPDVMMTAIRPNITADGIVVRIDGVARNYAAFISLQEKLLANPVFSRVYPVSERRLNPSLPQVTFALNFGYLPKVAAGVPPAVVAGPAGSAAGAEAPPSPAAVAAATPGAPPDAATGAAPAPPRAPAETQAAAPSAPPAPAGSVVGRDGLPRAATLARLVAAPGGLYVPSDSDSSDRPREAAPGKGKRGAAPPGPRPAAAASPPPGSGRTSASPQGTRGAAGGGPAGSPSKGEPGLPPWLQPARPAGRAPGAVPAAAVPALRLDVALAFAGKPVAEVYDALARAHGVRFALDGGVDPAAKITANLSGKSLQDAIAIVARAAGHRVTRQADGVYRVAAASGGEPIRDRPVTEESLPPPGGKP